MQNTGRFHIWATPNKSSIAQSSTITVLNARSKESAVAALSSVLASRVIVVVAEVGAFYWTALAPEIVNSGREEQGSVS